MIEQGEDRERATSSERARRRRRLWSKFWKRSSTKSVSGLGLADQPAGHDGDRAELAERAGQREHDAVGERASGCRAA